MFDGLKEKLGRFREDVARERIYSLVGSQHAVKRTQVELDAVEEVTAA